MNWFIDGIMMSEKDFEQNSSQLREAFRRYRSFSHAGQEGMDLLVLLKCWAYVFFRRGDGYNAFWSYLQNTVLECSTTREKELLKRLTIEEIKQRFGPQEGGVNCWFFKNCWMISGRETLATGRTRGFSSSMVRDVVRVNDILPLGPQSQDEIELQAEELAERVGARLALTLEDPFLRNGFFGTLRQNDLIREAIETFCRDAETSGTRSVAGVRWCLNTLNSWPTLDLLVEFSSSVNVDGHELSIPFRDGSCLRACIISGKAIFPGGEILVRLANNSAETKFAGGFLLDGKEMKGIDWDEEGTQILLSALKGEHAACFNESVNGDYHRLVVPENDNEGGEMLPIVVNRCLFAVGRADIVSPDGRHTRPLSRCPGVVVRCIGREDGLDLLSSGIRNLSGFGLNLRYRRRLNAAVFEGENDECVVHDEKGRRLHVFSGDCLIRHAEGNEDRVYNSPVDRAEVSLIGLPDGILYIPQMILDSIRNGGLRSTVGWKFTLETLSPLEMRKAGGRKGTLSVGGRNFSLLVTQEWRTPYVWLEREGGDVLPLIVRARGACFKSWNELRGTKLCCIPANSQGVSGDISICFRKSEGGGRNWHFSDVGLPWNDGCLKLPLDMFRREDEFSELNIPGADEISYVVDGHHFPLISVNVKPVSLRISWQEGRLMAYVPPKDDTGDDSVLLCLSEKFLGVRGELHDHPNLYWIWKPSEEAESGCQEVLLPDQFRDASHDVYVLPYSEFVADVRLEQLQRDFSLIKNADNALWLCVSERTDDEQSFVFDDNDALVSKLKYLEGLPAHAFRKAKLSNGYFPNLDTRLKTYLSGKSDAIEPSSLLRDFLKLLLDENINFLSAPAVPSGERKGNGWGGSKTWLHGAVRTFLLARGGDDLIREFNRVGNYTRMRGLLKKNLLAFLSPDERFEDEGSGWLPTACILPMLTSRSLPRICPELQWEVMNNAEAYSAAFVKEFRPLVKTDKTCVLTRAVWPLNFERERDYVQRREFYFGKRTLQELSATALIDSSDLCNQEEVVQCLQLVRRALRMCTENEAALKASSSERTYVLDDILESLLTDVDVGVVPMDLALLLGVAIGCRIEAAVWSFPSRIRRFPIECSDRLTKVVKQVFNLKYKGENALYWQMLMFYVTTVDLILHDF